MGDITTGSSLGNELQQLLMCDDLLAGDQPSYQMCKTIYLYHPLGAKMTESPIKLAQSQAREISIPGSPEEMVRDAFSDQWIKRGIDDIILNVMTVSRVYGIGSVALMAEGVPPNRPIDYKTLAGLELSFNVFDPLNSAGSLVLNQDPNSPNFQKPRQVAAAGTAYHPSRTVTVMNEKPVYIAYTNSAFGYVGRSVYQRALFPLKTFVQSMVTDDMVMKKSGVLVAMLQQAGSITDAIMAFVSGKKRQLLKEAKTDNVLSIGPDDKIETLNMQNLEGPATMSRKNILENIAMAADMPAKLLNQETFAEGFGEGTEDAKAVARYIDRIRLDMKQLYDFFDKVIQYLAWTPEFYKRVKEKFPEEYKDIAYTTAFYRWTNNFTAEWPNLLVEPDSEKIKVEETKLKAVISVAEILSPEIDPDNKATLIEWIQDNFNEDKILFKNPLELDIDALKDWLVAKSRETENNGEDDEGLTEPNQPHGFRDSQIRKKLRA